MNVFCSLFLNAPRTYWKSFLLLFSFSRAWVDSCQQIYIFHSNIYLPLSYQAESDFHFFHVSYWLNVFFPVCNGGGWSSRFNGMTASVALSYSKDYRRNPPALAWLISYTSRLPIRSRATPADSRKRYGVTKRHLVSRLAVFQGLVSIETT